MHGQLLYLIASVAGNLHFLTQFIRSYSLLLVNTTSWILLSKKVYLADLIVFIYLIQSVLFLEVWYKDRFLLHSLFYHALECLVILTCLVYLYQSSSMIEVDFFIIASRILQLYILVVLMLFTLFFNLFTNSSILLFLTIASFLS